ncbi:MAG TPA: DUF5777 family beta-barrel protein [Thermoanaerobaculia bacterium]|jgi:hypothetical protein
MIKTTTFAAALLLATTALAQDTRYTPTAPLPLGDTLLTLPTARIPSEGTWEVKFTHRFNQSIDQGSFEDQVHSLFGLDSNADVAFGLAFVPRPDIQVSVLRNNTNDTIEAAGKYVILQQANAVPVTASVRAGVDWRTEQDIADRTSFFAQAIVSRQFGRRAEVFVLPTFATHAGRAVTAGGSGALFENAFNVPVGVALMVRPALSVVAEIIPPNGDLPDEMDGQFGWALGIKRAIGGHYFELLLTNSTGTTVDQYVSSTFQGTAFETGNLHLGFNIERRFGRRLRR